MVLDTPPRCFCLVLISISITGWSSGYSAQAELFISTTTNPGNYTLGLGIDTGRVTVWSMVQVQVTAQPPTTPIGTSLTLVSVAAVILVVVVLVLGQFFIEYVDSDLRPPQHMTGR